jgi:hypothetical protein
MIDVLPKELDNPEVLELISVAGSQFSQLVAWSWSSAFVTDEPEYEESLKLAFRQTLQNQNKLRMTYLSDGDEQSQDEAKNFSQQIKDLLQSDELSELLKKLNGKELIFRESFFADQFRYEVIGDKFSASLEKNNDKSANTPEEYTIFLPYPPCPVLGESTFTEQVLKSWMRGDNADHLPPNPYIVMGSF